MQRHRLARSTIGAISLLLLVSSCESGGERVLVEPTGPRFITTVEDTSGNNYELVQADLASELIDLDVSDLIGPEGGQLELAGHTLTVPAGAVDELTLFTLTVVNDGYVTVDLSATVTDLLGNVLDVGSDGFAKPVTLSLTYSWAKDVADPSRLLLLRMLGESHSDPHEALESRVDEEAEVVISELDHFSLYCMASN